MRMPRDLSGDDVVVVAGRCSAWACPACGLIPCQALGQALSLR